MKHKKRVQFLLVLLAVLLASCSVKKMTVVSGMAVLYDCPSSECTPLLVLTAGDEVEVEEVVKENPFDFACSFYVPVRYKENSGYICLTDLKESDE